MIKNLIIMILAIVVLVGGFGVIREKGKQEYKGLMIACYELGYTYGETNTPKEEGIKKIEEIVEKIL
ncbi:MAG TPA: hypothetical protein VMZ91_13625 [Candidatus Paceibacterota bacterium]|nr:hypothetical protein [Candidatus Paceibacterota bacterium]